MVQSVSPSVSPSICLSLCSHAFLNDGWIDFLHIGYHDQVPRVADSSIIEFGSVPNLSNVCYFFIDFECLLCYLSNNVVILFIFSTVVRYNVLLMFVK